MKTIPRLGQIRECPPGTCRRLIKFPLSLRMGYFALVKYSSHLPLQIKVVACSDRQPLFVIHIADLSLTPSCVEILVLQSLFIRICHANWPSLRYGKVTCNLLSYLPGKASSNAPAYQRGRVIKTGSLTSAYELAWTPAKNSYHDLLKKKNLSLLRVRFLGENPNRSNRVSQVKPKSFIIKPLCLEHAP